MIRDCTFRVFLGLFAVLMLWPTKGLRSETNSRILPPASNGYFFKIEGIDDQSLKNMELRGQIEILQLSFGQFGFLPEENSQLLSDPEFFALRTQGSITSLQPNYYYELHSDSESELQDADWRLQWNLANTGKNNWAGGPAGEDVHALDAWRITKGNARIIIAVIDSGVKVDHPDLQENIFTNDAELNGLPGIDDDNNGYIDDVHGYDFADSDSQPNDEISHGTHVSGIIGAKHNLIGVAGVMDNVKILPLKFIGKDRRGEAKNAVLAVDYAIKMGARIINCSWGADSPSEALQLAIEAANEKGILITASAGNSNSNNDTTPVYPSSFESPNIISVGSTNGRGERSSFSNYGKLKVDIFAPGSQIISITPDDKNTLKSGTSMAAPMVAGALGLLLSNLPDLTPVEAKKRLLDTTDNKERFSEIGKSGRLNLFRLLTGQVNPGTL